MYSLFKTNQCHPLILRAAKNTYFIDEEMS